jgi:hypothetical protein
MFQSILDHPQAMDNFALDMILAQPEDGSKWAKTCCPKINIIKGCELWNFDLNS